MEIGTHGKVKSTSLITLEKSGDVCFGSETERVKGQWKYYFQQDAISFFTVEFSGNGRWPWKRHLMLQNDENKFRLLEKGDPCYMGETDLWRKNSVPHENKHQVAMLKIDGKEFTFGH